MKRSVLLVLTALSCFAQSSQAQQPKAAEMKPSFSAAKWSGSWGSETGFKLEGNATQPAHFKHPQLEVIALSSIAFAFDKDAKGETRLKSATATGKVNFKVSLAQKGAAPVRIEANCQQAIFAPTPTARTLALNGGVDGWFQSGNGPRNQLRGQSVQITSQPEGANTLIADIKGDAQGVRVDVPPPGQAAPGAKPITITAQNAQLRQNEKGLDADVDGGTLGVRLEIPAMPKNASSNALNLGAVVVTSQRASVRQADGQARFIGNARAASSGEGAVKFDVTADELSLHRAANGEVATIKTTGRSKMKLDLPPDADAKPVTSSTNKISFGTPNYLEVEANMATADLSKNTLVFEGDVNGFYRLPVNGPQATTPTDYKLSGERAVISYAPEAGAVARGLKVEVTGDPLKNKQAQFDLPPFELEGF